MTSTDEDVAAAIERVEAACTRVDIDPDGTAEASSADTSSADDPHVPRDADGWVHRAAFRLLLGDVAESRVVEALDEVAAQIVASGEGPYELFGDPDSWVAERRARWREAGTEHVVRPRPGLLDLLGESLFTAAILSTLFFLHRLITWSWDDPLSLAMLLFPVAIGLIARAVPLVFTEVRSARSQSMGVLAAVGTTGVGIVATLGLLVLTRNTEVGGPAALWLLGLAVVCAGLGTVLAVVAPERPARPAPAPQDEEGWFDALARALREREDMTDARAEAIVAESRAHAREAGAAPAEEFGAARAYAARFSGTPGLARRREAWFLTVCTLLVLIYVVASMADGTASVWGFAWLLVAGLLAALAWRAARRT